MDLGHTVCIEKNFPASLLCTFALLQDVRRKPDLAVHNSILLDKHVTNGQETPQFTEEAHNLSQIIHLTVQQRTKFGAQEVLPPQ